MDNQLLWSIQYLLRGPEVQGGLLLLALPLAVISAFLFNGWYAVLEGLGLTTLSVWWLVIVGVWWISVRWISAGGRYKAKHDLNGKVVLITGGNTGIGRATGELFAQMGATVLLACRDMKKAEEAIKYIELHLRTKNLPADRVSAVPLDLASLASVRALVEMLEKRGTPIHYLINNAGVMMCPYGKTADGFELQMGSNHLGHMALTLGLLSNLKANQARIVSLSSAAHALTGFRDVDQMINPTEKEYDKSVQYGNSKLANILFARHLQTLLGNSGAAAYSCHPGAVATELGRHVSIMELAIKLLAPVILKTPSQGAQSSLFCALSPAAVPGEFHQDAQYTPCSPLGRDTKLAQQLWTASCKLINIPE